MNRPALRIICSVHGRQIARVYAEGERMIFESKSMRPRALADSAVFVAKCPRCELTHVIEVDTIRRALRARSVHVLRLAPTPPPSHEDLLGAWDAAGRPEVI